MKKWIQIGFCLIAVNCFSTPVAKVTARVVDDMGVPVHNATVSFVFNMYQDEKTYRGTTDTNGLFSAEGETGLHVYLMAKKAGFYESGENYYFKFLDEDKTRFEPWGEVRTLTLRQIMDPKEGKKGLIKGRVPVFNKAVGIDLEIGDWVAPFGRGIRSDFTVTCNNYTNEKVISYVIDCPNRGDGIIPYSCGDFEQSIYRWPYLAPQNGYLPVIKKKRTYTFDVDPDMLLDYEELPASASAGNYIFRIRTVYDEGGNIKSAYYGKIMGLIQIFSDGELSFSYWLNTDPHSRSLESMDPSSP